MITKKELWEALAEMEKRRVCANDKNDYPPSDHPYRRCQAVIANLLGYKDRVSWQNKMNHYIAKEEINATLVNPK